MTTTRPTAPTFEPHRYGFDPPRNAPDPWATSKALHAVYAHPFRYTVSPGGMLPGSRLGGLRWGFEVEDATTGEVLAVFPAAYGRAVGGLSPVDDAFNAARRCAWDYREVTERLPG